MTNTLTCDLLVVGCGAAGMSAAITAGLHGLEVIVVEKGETFGGTTAVSGGGFWIPCNPLAVSAGIPDSIEDAMLYLRGLAGTAFDAERALSYLNNGPRMVDFFQRSTAMKFALQADAPDYHLSVPGSRLGGRTLYTTPFDGRELGSNFRRLERPLRELTVLGVAVPRSDLRKFYDATRSVTAAAFVAKRLFLQACDQLRYGRSVRLVNGNALAARLAKSVFDLRIPVLLSTAARSLVRQDGRIKGATITKDGRHMQVVARKGVVLATGGFSRDLERRKDLYAHAPAEQEHWSLCNPGNTGDGLRLGEEVGAEVSCDYQNAAYWAPISIVPRQEGPAGLFPHTSGVDRSKPGYIAVTPSGRRFVNECVTYHDFVQAMIREARDAGRNSAHCYLICDHRALRRYGMGAVRPFPFPIGPHLRSGYLKRANTIQDLARQLAIAPDNLARTLHMYNAGARVGQDTEYGRGQDQYQRYHGDPRHKPNPCVAPIAVAPFYALKLLPGDVGTFAGLRTDGIARVLNTNGEPIAGLYAIGNDMASITQGVASPGAGITLGPALTFGFVAGEHAARAI